MELEFLELENEVVIKDKDNKDIAYIRFPMMEDGTVNIETTFVDSSLQGQGVASKLVSKAYDVIKSHKWKAKLTCSYAKNWFDKHPDKTDILY